MPDRRRVLGLLLGSAGVALPGGLAALAGCGVPTGGAPIVDGQGPAPGGGGLFTAGLPPEPGDATSPADLVRKYLLAVAGPLDRDHREFMTATMTQNWTPDQQTITVVRQVGDPTQSQGADVTTVTISLQPVGSLNDYGQVIPGLSRAASCQFSVVDNPAGDGTWLIDDIKSSPNLVNNMLLSGEALDASLGLYTPQLLYFWTTTNKSGMPDGLVPDLRYLAVADIAQVQYTAVVNALLNGPSDWLEVASAFSGAESLVGPFVKPGEDGVLGVALSRAASNADLTRFMSQLRWSLHSLYRGPVQLLTNSQVAPVDGTSDGYLKWNLCDTPARPGGTPEEFCIVDGKVVPMVPAPTPPVLAAPENSNVLWAAISRDKTFAALVRETGGKHQLVLGQKGEGDKVTYQPVAFGSADKLSRPAFLPGQARVLIINGGQLYLVTVGGAVTEVTPSGVSNLAAFSVAPDGHRIALVGTINEQPGVALASLTPSADTVIIGAPMAIDAGGLDANSLGAVAWSRPDRVILGGSRTLAGVVSHQLAEVTVDGAHAVLSQQLTNQVTHLVGYPQLPSVSAGPGRVLGQAGTGKNVLVFQYAGTQPVKLPPLAVGPSPSASPSSTAGRATTTTFSAPFFLD
jgi:hypothetical protein